MSLPISRKTRPTRWSDRARRAGMLLGTLLLGCVETDLTHAEQRPHIPPVAAIETGEYLARDDRSGTDLWRHGWTIERHNQPDGVTLRVQQEGQGRRGHSAPTVWVAEMHVTLRGSGYRLSSRREVHDAQGALVETEERDLDSTTGAGLVTIRDARSGRTSVRRVRVTRTSVDLEMLSVELRLLPGRADKRTRFELIMAEGETVGMEATIVGREVVEVPAGTFECYRIELAATGALGLVAGLVLPKTTLWHTVAPPHVWVKHRGSEGGVGSRTIIRELTRFERQGE
jgi:hypothetical protein